MIVTFDTEVLIKGVEVPVAVTADVEQDLDYGVDGSPTWDEAVLLSVKTQAKKPKPVKIDKATREDLINEACEYARDNG